MFSVEDLRNFHAAVDVVRAYAAAHSCCVPYEVALELAKALEVARYECRTLGQFSLEGAAVIQDALTAFEPYNREREREP